MRIHSPARHLSVELFSYFSQFWTLSFSSLTITDADARRRHAEYDQEHPNCFYFYSSHPIHSLPNDFVRHENTKSILFNFITFIALSRSTFYRLFVSWMIEGKRLRDRNDDRIEIRRHFRNETWEFNVPLKLSVRIILNVGGPNVERLRLSISNFIYRCASDRVN